MTDIFNSTFFILLGILVLVVALIVVYFESKSREQNHKISSMLSLVSTLAEDMNGVKMGMHHLSLNAVGGGNFQPPPQPVYNHLEETNMQLFQTNNDNLISVSDDDSDDESTRDSDDESTRDSDDGINNEMESDSDSDNSSKDSNEYTKIKILKININDSKMDSADIENEMGYNVLEDMTDFENIDESSEVGSELDEDSQTSDLNIDETHSNEGENNCIEETSTATPLNISMTDLKTINITLEEKQSDSIDYKKLPLAKLRSIVIEKGLASSDTSKMKKHELLNLLEAE